jgi:glycosyltransferase involved in cell wall biosynthesis
MSQATSRRQKLFYIGYTDILKGRVGPHIMMHNCSALAELGHDVTIVVPTIRRPENTPRDRLWEHYGLPPGRFRIVMLRTPLVDRSHLFWLRLCKILGHLAFSLCVLREVLSRPKGAVALIFWSFIEALPYLLMLGPLRRLKGVRFVHELHTFVDTPGHRLLLRRMDGVLCINESLRRRLCGTIPFDENATRIGRCGVDLDRYPEVRDTREFRRALGLGEQAWIAMYTGKVSPELKEIELILQAARRMPDASFVFVGGKESAVTHWKEYCGRWSITNAVFTGFVPPTAVSRYQMAADALVMYYPGDWPLRDALSPGKLMEYMAAASPIVSVDFEVLREVLKDGENALLVQPDDPDGLVRALRRLKSDPELGRRLGLAARAEAGRHTWRNRARKFVELLS